eukprot:363145-Chlamydomonas_euryale.AAC.2
MGLGEEGAFCMKGRQNRPTTVMNIFLRNVGSTDIDPDWSVSFSNAIYKMPEAPNTWNIVRASIEHACMLGKVLQSKRSLGLPGS